MRFQLRRMSHPASYIIIQFACVFVIVGGCCIPLMTCQGDTTMTFYVLMMLILPAFMICMLSILLFWLNVKYGYFIIDNKRITVLKYGFIRRVYDLEEVKKLEILTTKYGRRNMINWTGDVVAVFDNTFLSIKFWFSYDALACDMISSASGCSVIDHRAIIK